MTRVSALLLIIIGSIAMPLAEAHSATCTTAEQCGSCESGYHRHAKEGGGTWCTSEDNDPPPPEPCPGGLYIKPVCIISDPEQITNNPSLFANFVIISGTTVVAWWANYAFCTLPHACG